MANTWEVKTNWRDIMYFDHKPNIDDIKEHMQGRYDKLYLDTQFNNSDYEIMEIVDNG